MMVDRPGGSRDRRNPSPRGFAGGGELGSGGRVAMGMIAAPVHPAFVTGVRLGEDPYDSLHVLDLSGDTSLNFDEALTLVEQFGRSVRLKALRAAVRLPLPSAKPFVLRQDQLHHGHRDLALAAERNLQWRQHRLLTEAAHRVGMQTMASAADEHAVDLCMSLGIDLLKIASVDIRNHRLIKAVTDSRFPAIAFADGAALEEVEALIADFAEQNISYVLDRWLAVSAYCDRRIACSPDSFVSQRHPRLTIRFLPPAPRH